MRWLLRRKRNPGASARGRERYSPSSVRERPPQKEVDPEQIVGALNYEPEEPEAEAGELARQAWSATIVIAVAFVSLMVITLLAYAGSSASATWRGWRADPLVRAAAEGNTNEMRALIERGADLNAAGRNGETPLVAAARNGQQEAAEMLLAAGAEPSEAAVNTALRYDQRDVLISLIEGGADPDTRSEWSVSSLLEIAARQGDAKLVELLLEHGADPDSAPGENPLGITALHIAINSDNREIVRLLLDHGADPLQKHQGWTALEVASRSGDEEMARMLREAALSEEQ